MYTSQAGDQQRFFVESLEGTQCLGCGKGLARACAKIPHSMMFTEPGVAAAEIVPALQQLAAHAESLVPQFAALKSGPHKGPRQPGDRRLNPIRGGGTCKKRLRQCRRKEQLRITRFARVKSCGRPPKRGRGPMFMVGTSRLCPKRQRSMWKIWSTSLLQSRVVQCIVKSAAACTEE